MITEPTPENETEMKKKAQRRRFAIASGSIFGIALVAGGIAIALNGQKQPLSNGLVAVPAGSPLTTNSAPSPTATPTPTPATLASHLNGLQVPAGSEYARPLAVMIENTPDARPQAGLSSASVVYEAIAEGGITRFMAVFGNAATPVRVGPVRSARPYYVDYAQELGALFAHAGGSQDGLAEIPKTGVPDLDGLSIGSPIFYRWNPHNVAYEHTLYSSTDALWNYAKGRYSTNGTYASWNFAAAAPAATPTATKITTSVSAADYDAEWDYDAASNSYLRKTAGVAHTDLNTGKQLSATDVILQQVVRVDSTERYGSIVKPISYYTLTGSGNATIFENGVAIKATWKKDGSGRTRYYDTSGAEVTFVPGEIWVQLVEADSRITY